MNKKIRNLALLTLICASACKSPEQTAQEQPQQQLSQELPKFDTEGHRGARGLAPENTIPAMRKAIDLGMTTIEMDAHITKDHKVVITHDPHINPLYAQTQEGKDLTSEEKNKYAIYQMDYAQVRQFKMGTKFFDQFPQQELTETYIPLLSELIDSVQLYLDKKNLPQVFYNIETKSKEKGDNQLHPEPATFVKLLMEVVESKGITPWVIVQSFDFRTLQELHKSHPHVKTSLLTNNKKTFEENLADLGFTPTIYSPHHTLVTAELVKACHERNIKVVPWTANTAEDIARLKALGVDGIITDYPNLLAEQL